MKIVVTQEHIDRAYNLFLKGSESYKCCPIALAINGEAGFDCLWDKNAKTYKPTKAMKEFMRNFDNGIRVEPSTFIVKRDGRKFYRDK
jgi:hypothetical protein